MGKPVVPVTIKEPVAEPVPVIDAAPVVKAAPKSKIVEKKSGFFNFGSTSKPKSKPVMKKEETVTAIDPTPEVPPAPLPVLTSTKSKKLSPFSFGKPKAQSKPKPIITKLIEKKEDPVAPAPAPAANAAATRSGGVFNFLFGQPKKKQSPLQIIAAKLLNNDKKLIAEFQNATDSYRTSDLSAPKFIDYLVSTFGEEDLDLILEPFFEELPEKDIGIKLKDANEKRKIAAKKPASGFFSNLFKPKGKTTNTPLSSKKLSTTVVNTTKITSKATKISTRSPKVFKEGLAGLPSSKRTFVNAKLRSFKMNRIDAKAVVSSLTSELGKERALNVIKDLTAQLPNDLANQLNAAVK